MYNKPVRKQLNLIRSKRARAVLGRSHKPRLSVYRSNYALTAQIIDEKSDKVLVAKTMRGKNQQVAQKLGAEIAALALKMKIKSVVFDRSGNRYHGVIKIIADTVRQGGLKL